MTFILVDVERAAKIVGLRPRPI